MAQASPTTLIEWLRAELDRKLASLPSDQARYRELILQDNAWRGRYEAFARCGEHPFGGPHPIHGRMSASDFTLLLSLIADRRQNLISAREAA